MTKNPIKGSELIEDPILSSDEMKKMFGIAREIVGRDDDSRREYITYHVRRINAKIPVRSPIKYCLDPEDVGEYSVGDIFFIYDVGSNLSEDGGEVYHAFPVLVRKDDILTLDSYNSESSLSKFFPEKK